MNIGKAYFDKGIVLRQDGSIDSRPSGTFVVSTFEDALEAAKLATSLAEGRETFRAARAMVVLFDPEDTLTREEDFKRADRKLVSERTEDDGTNEEKVE